MTDSTSSISARSASSADSPATPYPFSRERLGQTEELLAVLAGMSGRLGQRFEWDILHPWKNWELLTQITPSNIRVELWSLLHKDQSALCGRATAAVLGLGCWHITATTEPSSEESAFTEKVKRTLQRLEALNSRGRDLIDHTHYWEAICTPIYSKAVTRLFGRYAQWAKPVLYSATTQDAPAAIRSALEAEADRRRVRLSQLTGYGCEFLSEIMLDPARLHENIRIWIGRNACFCEMPMALARYAISDAPTMTAANFITAEKQRRNNLWMQSTKPPVVILWSGLNLYDDDTVVRRYGREFAALFNDPLADTTSPEFNELLARAHRIAAESTAAAAAPASSAVSIGAISIGRSCGPVQLTGAVTSATAAAAPAAELAAAKAELADLKAKMAALQQLLR